MMTEHRRDVRQEHVRKHYSQFFYDDLIYIHITNIFILISDPSLKMEEMREKLLSDNRIRAIQEEIIRFLLTEVISEKGEYHCL